MRSRSAGESLPCVFRIHVCMFLSVLAWLYKVQGLRRAGFRERLAMHMPSGSRTVPIAPSDSTLCPPLPCAQAAPRPWATLRLLLIHWPGATPSPSPGTAPSTCPSQSHSRALCHCWCPHLCPLQTQELARRRQFFWSRPAWLVPNGVWWPLLHVWGLGQDG